MSLDEEHGREAIHLSDLGPSRRMQGGNDVPSIMPEMGRSSQEEAAAPGQVHLAPDEEGSEEWGRRDDELFKSLPQPSIRPSDMANASDLSQYQNRPGYTVAQAWQKCSDAMQTYDADSCKAHREEIDTLLVFAGLFSAVVTAFTIESYQWLQSDPNDTIIALLSRIAPPDNETQKDPMPSGLPDQVSVRINVYWFLSLALSLSAALVAILCKQWVREFERHADESHKQLISVRQMKLEGFEWWGVASVVTAVPLLLQSALGLFSLGLIELLWKLHRAVGVAVLVPTVLSLVFYSSTTLLPGLQSVSRLFKCLRRIPQCPFKSPQAILTLRALLISRRALAYILGVLRVRVLYGRVVETWNDVGRWVRDAWRSLSGSHSDPTGPIVRPRSVTTLGPAPEFPSLQAMSSWVTLDREFTAFRDAAYRPLEYQAARESGDRNAVPPISCVRGLLWLYDHIDQPAMASWIWLCTWDIARSVEPRRGLPEHDLGVAGTRWSVSFLASRIGRVDIPGDTPPTDMALLCGFRVGLEPAFIAEILVNHLSSLRLDVLIQTLRWIIRNDDNCMHSVLYAILASLISATEARDTGLGPFIGQVLEAAIDATYIKRTLSPPEVSCIGALYFRELLTHGEGISERWWTLQKLVKLGLDSVVAQQRGEPGRRISSLSPGVLTVLATLAHTLHRNFEHGVSRMKSPRNTSCISGADSEALALLRPLRHPSSTSKSSTLARTTRLRPLRVLLASRLHAMAVDAHKPCQSPETSSPLSEPTPPPGVAAGVHDASCRTGRAWMCYQTRLSCRQRCSPRRRRCSFPPTASVETRRQTREQQASSRPRHEGEEYEDMLRHCYQDLRVDNDDNDALTDRPATRWQKPAHATRRWLASRHHSAVIARARAPK